MRVRPLKADRLHREEAFNNETSAQSPKQQKLTPHHPSSNTSKIRSPSWSGMEFVLAGRRPWFSWNFPGPSRTSATRNRYSSTTQEWCKAHFLGFITSTEWSLYSPEFNTMDYVWSILEARIYTKLNKSLE